MRILRTGKATVRGTRSGITMAMGCAFVATLTMAAVGQSHVLKVAQKTNWTVIEKFEYYDGTSWVAVEETDASIVYSGTWSPDACGAYGQMSSNSSGAYCEFPFTGTGVRWYDEGEPNYQSDIYIDGVFQQTVTTVIGNCTMVQYENSDVSGVARESAVIAGRAPAIVVTPQPLGGSLLIRCVLPVGAEAAVLTIQDVRGRTLWRDRRSALDGSEFAFQWTHRSAPRDVFVVSVTGIDENGRKTGAPARLLTSQR